jgi:anhydro-N-acetylmuramic acid kinase
VQKEVFPLLESSGLKVEDQISTFTEHVVVQLASVFKPESSILVTGGGAYNTFLLERIKNCKNFNLILPDERIIEFKEALIFGLLGVLKIRGENNCLASVTGAKMDHSSGKVYSP